MTYATPLTETSIAVTTATTSTTSIRFQKELKETKNFGDALVAVFAELVQLKIVTWVAANGDTEAKPGNRLKTTINLIDGDIENEIGSRFLTDAEYLSLREFHESQVAKGSETIANNLKTLVGIGEKVTAMLTGESAPEKEEDLDFGNASIPFYSTSGTGR